MAGPGGDPAGPETGGLDGNDRRCRRRCTRRTGWTGRGGGRRPGFGALLLTPGPDLRYVTGYDAHQLERLTCLAVPAERPPFLVVPRLELPAALASPAGDLGLEHHRLGRDRRSVRSWSPRRLRPGHLGRPGRPDVGADDAAAARRAAGRPAGPGQRGAARPAHPQDPRRGRRAAARRARPSTGCTPGCRAGCGRAGPSGQVAADIATRSWPRATRGPTSRSSASGPERGQPAPRRVRAGAAPAAMRSWSTSAARCRAATARTAPGPT